MRALTVLCGAGASYDCANDTAVTDPKWRPPLVDQLFDRRENSFSDLLKKYPKAEQIAEEIRNELATPGEARPSVESLLRRQADGGGAIGQRYLEIPLYLQDVVSETGRRYILSGKTKFSPLVSEIERFIGNTIDNVTYLTLNYDILLDREIEILYGLSFTNIQDYVYNNKFKLIKLHGSVNWGYPFLDTNTEDLNSLLKILSISSLSSYLYADNITIMDGIMKRVKESKYLYPAIAVPVEGKSEFVCPPKHLNHAMSAIAGSENFLILGCRLADEHVRQLFANVRAVKMLKVVDRDGKSAMSVASRLSDFPAFSRHANLSSSVHPAGFCDFITSGALRRFLEQC